ncbi:MAG: YigZ family protein [Acidobacteriota bacterium]
MTDDRAVPAREGRFEIRERASRFLAFALPCESPDQGSAAVAAWRREYHDASHVAFAWKMGPPGEARARASDAGEPAGTAGKPIAAAIETAGLTDVLVGVVRYFGGTKLGTGGLARAYRNAAAGALRDAGRAVRADTRVVTVTCDYARIGELRRLVDPPRIAVVGEAFGDDARVRLAVYRSRVPALSAALVEARLKHTVEES